MAPTPVVASVTPLPPAMLALPLTEFITLDPVNAVTLTPEPPFTYTVPVPVVDTATGPPVAAIVRGALVVVMLISPAAAVV